MNLSHRWIGAVSVVVAFIVATVAVYLTGGTQHECAQIFDIGILLAAWTWRIWGGLITAIIAGLICGPVIPLDRVTRLPESHYTWLIRLGVFCLIGVFAGYFSMRNLARTRLLEERNAQLERNQAKILEQERHIETVGTELIETVAHAIELRDPYTNGHCRRVAQLSVEIGRRLGLSGKDILHLEWAALVHDVGKIGIPESILNKDDKLTDAEYAVMKSHPELGEFVINRTRHGGLVKGGVGAHHERWDGKGYPRGLAGHAIPLQGRIIAVADVWDAISSERSYRQPLPKEERMKIMRDGRGTAFDPATLAIFFEIINETSIGE